MPLLLLRFPRLITCFPSDLASVTVGILVPKDVFDYILHYGGLFWFLGYTYLWIDVVLGSL
jgi:hypothetical protein